MADNCPFDISPLDQSETLARPNIFNLNYTNQDFWSMKSRLIDFIRQQFSTDFNDFVESSLAVMLIENWSFLADTLSFKIDQIANEIFIDTVTETENAFRLSNLVGFKPTPPIAARSLWTATINNPVLTDVPISTPLDIETVSGDTPIRIELFPADHDNNPIFDQNIIIPAGQTINSSIVGLEGRTFSEEFQGTGEANQSYEMGFSPVIMDSVRVTVDGVKWSEVDFFSDSQRRREFRVEFDSEYTAFCIFGGSRAGLIPSRGSRIVVTYRVGGGTIGNIVTGFVETQTIVSVPGLQFTLPVNFRNYTKGEFGYDGDTVEDIRRKLPDWIRTQNRAVSGLDYKVLADQFSTPFNGQIGKSTAVLRNHGCAGNVIDLYILAKDGVTGLVEAENELKVALENELENKKMFTDYVCIRDGIIVETDISIDVVMDKFYRKFENEFKERVQRRTDRFFSLNNWEYGKTLRANDLVKELSDIREVTRYEVSFTTNDSENSGELVTTKFNEIVRPDTTEISFIFE